MGREMHMGVKIKAKCFHCGNENELDIEPAVTNGKTKYNFICQNCGALNELSIDPMNLNDTEQDWLCGAPNGFEWIMPSGKVMPIVGDPIYVSALGEYLTRSAYLEKYKLDPEIAYQFMRKNRNTQTSNIITRHFNSSHATTQPFPGLASIKEIEVCCENCSHVTRLSLGS